MVSSRAILQACALVVFAFVAVGCRSTDRNEPTDGAVPSATAEPAATTAQGEAPTVGVEPTLVPAPEGETPGTVASPPEHLGAGSHTISLRHGGRDRSYIVFVPSRAAGPLPILFALHGGGGTGAGFQEQNGFDPIAEREGFVVVYPEGTGVLPNRLHTWNSGETCCGFALDRNIDDVGFLREVLEDVATRTAADRGRIYMTGHSNGAMMAYRFAAESAELVTAIAPVGGVVDLTNFALSQPVATLHIHSVDDPRAIYEGGDGPPFPGTERTVNHEPVLPGIEAWAAANGCSPEFELEQVADGGDDGVNAGQVADRLFWSDCSVGGEVEHLRLTGTGHGWPGVTVGRAWQRLLGPPTTLVNASEAVWAFVSRFER